MAGDFDLRRHSEFSGKNLQYSDEQNNKFLPYVVETSVGCDRFVLAVMCDAYRANEDRVVMKFHPKFAPYKVAVFPLMKKDGLPEKAREIFDDLKWDYKCFYEEKDAIGKRYRRMDAIGTPFCVTVDHQTIEDQTVTLRHRDSMEQERVPISSLMDIINKAIS